MKYIYITLAVILLVILPIRGWMFYATKTEVQDYHIIKTERVVDGGESKYLIFAKEETLKNVDTWWGLKFNSSDVYGRIAAGQTCSFTVTGVRFPMLSWYRNILDATCS
jgi:hypothetical protein